MEKLTDIKKLDMILAILVVVGSLSIALVFTML